MRRAVVLLVLVAVIFGFVLAIKYLDWWVLLALIVAMVVGARYGVRLLLRRLFMMPFKAKGAVLRDAAVRIHSIEPAEGPPTKLLVRPARDRTEEDEDLSEDEDVDEEPEQDMGPRSYYRVEVTIDPRPKKGGFQHWEPGELLLVRPETDVMKFDEDDDTCRIDELEVEQDGRFQTDEGWKFVGPARLRMRIGVRPDVRRLTFQYYFEKFGELELPTGAP
jgi:hypothetical protein